MPMPKTWLLRAEEILEILRRMRSQQLERPAIEEIFQLQRRAAIELMTLAGAQKVKRGSAFLIDRTALLSWVKSVYENEAWNLERRRQSNEELSREVHEIQAIREAMAAEGRKPVSFIIEDGCLRASCASLPLDIQIDYGHITIKVVEGTPYDMQQRACQLLYELAMAINNDPDNFRNLISTHHSSSGTSRSEAVPQFASRY